MPFERGAVHILEVLFVSDFGVIPLSEVFTGAESSKRMPWPRIRKSLMSGKQKKARTYLSSVRQPPAGAALLHEAIFVFRPFGQKRNLLAPQAEKS